MHNDQEFIAISEEQIIDPASGELIAHTGQLLRRDDMQRILAIEHAAYHWRSAGRRYDEKLFHCWWCDKEGKDLVTGYDIFFGVSCPHCEYPRWILKEG